jgi:hypothetical protein
MTSKGFARRAYLTSNDILLAVERGDGRRILPCKLALN